MSGIQSTSAVYTQLVGHTKTQHDSLLLYYIISIQRPSVRTPEMPHTAFTLLYYVKCFKL